MCTYRQTVQGQMFLWKGGLCSGAFCRQLFNDYLIVKGKLFENKCLQYKSTLSSIESLDQVIHLSSFYKCIASVRVTTDSGGCTI